MESDIISGRLNKDEVDGIKRFLEGIRNDEESLNNFYRSPDKTLKRFGLDIDRLGITKEQKNEIIEDTVVLVSRMINGEVVIDPDTYKYKGNTLANAESDSNTDVSPSALPEPEFKQNADIAADQGGISLKVKKYSDGPLISDRNMKVILSYLIGSINQAKQIETK